MGNVPPPRDEALHQGSTRRPLQKETNDRLKARLLNIVSSFRGEQVEQFHHLICPSSASIRG